jgi:hypothetical protein
MGGRSHPAVSPNSNLGGPLAAIVGGESFEDQLGEREVAIGLFFFLLVFLLSRLALFLLRFFRGGQGGCEFGPFHQELGMGNGGVLEGNLDDLGDDSRPVVADVTQSGFARCLGNIKQIYVFHNRPFMTAARAANATKAKRAARRSARLLLKNASFSTYILRISILPNWYAKF